jgi:hypothetical protein
MLHFVVHWLALITPGSWRNSISRWLAQLNLHNVAISLLPSELVATNPLLAALLVRIDTLKREFVQATRNRGMGGAMRSAPMPAKLLEASARRYRSVREALRLRVLLNGPPPTVVPGGRIAGEHAPATVTVYELWCFCRVHADTTGATSLSDRADVAATRSTEGRTESRF